MGTTAQRLLLTEWKLSVVEAVVTRLLSYVLLPKVCQVACWRPPEHGHHWPVQPAAFAANASALHSRRPAMPADKAAVCLRFRSIHLRLIGPLFVDNRHCTPPSLLSGLARITTPLERCHAGLSRSGRRRTSSSRPIRGSSPPGGQQAGPHAGHQLRTPRKRRLRWTPCQGLHRRPP